MNRVSKPPFIIILKNERVASYHKLAYVFAGIQVAAFIFFLFYGKSLYTGIVGLVLTTIYFLLRRYLVKKGRQKYVLDENIFLLFAAVWLWISVVMAILMFVTALLYRYSIQEWKFIFKDDGVYKSFFPKKHHEWTAFFNIVLKDGMLTLDFSNNHLLQVLAENSDEIDEHEFNVYVHQQLAKVKNVPE